MDVMYGVSEDEAFLKDNVDLMVFREHDEHVPVTATGDRLMYLLCLQTAYYEVKNNSKTVHFVVFIEHNKHLPAALTEA